MKILVVSLLRLGDTVMATSVIPGLKEKYKGCQIDFLINDEVQHIVPVVAGVNKFHVFDRSLLQLGLASASRNVFEPLERLNRLLDSIKDENYDLVVNLTHNKLSAWIMAAIDCKEKLGIEIRPNGVVAFGSPWFRYLNDYLTSSRTDIFHFIDVFAYALGLNDLSRRISVQSTPEGQKEAAQILDGVGRFVAVQPLTSDIKKNWGTDRFIETCRLLSKLDHDLTMVIVGSPSERLEIQSLVGTLKDKGVPCRMAVCSVPGLVGVLSRAQLTITGDTATKHFAAAVCERVLELSLGSSAYAKTGVYAAGSVILQSREPCAPCGHRTVCPYPIHPCAARMSEDLVALTAFHLLHGRIDQLRMIASEYIEEADVLWTTTNSSGDWSAIPLSRSFEQRFVLPWLDRSAWKLFLNGSDLQKIPALGSEALELKTLLMIEFPDELSRSWTQNLGQIEKQVEHLEQSVTAIFDGLKRELKQVGDPHALPDFYTKLSSQLSLLAQSPVGESYSVALKGILEPRDSRSFLYAKRVRETLGGMQRRSRIQLKLIRTVKQQMMEII